MLYYSWPESEFDAMEIDIQHVLEHVTEGWRLIRATMLERVKFTNINRSQNHGGDDYMSQLKFTVLGCNFINSEKRTRGKFFKGINNQNTRRNF